MSSWVQIKGAFFMRKYFAEFFGTMLLVIFATTALIYVTTFQTGQLFDAMAIFGLALAALMFIFGPMANGGHFNPAVSLGAAINKDISWKTFGGYFLAQFLGAFAGLTLSVYTLIPIINAQQSSSSSSSTSSVKASQLFSLLEPSAASAISVWLAVAIELFFTFVLVFITLVALKKHIKQSAAITGISFTLISFVTYPLTNGLVNPARVLAPALYKGLASSAHLWYFLIAEILGGLLAGLVVKYFMNEDDAAVKSVAE